MICSHKEEAARKEEIAIAKIKSNTKYFYKYAKSKSKTKTEIGPFHMEGNYVEDPKTKAEILLDQYTLVFISAPYDKLIEDIMQIPGVHGLDDVHFTASDIEKSIARLKSFSSPGPDGVPSILLKECSSEIAVPICLICNKSMEEGSIPDSLKDGIVTPVYKGGDKTQPKNYRPVTLTSHIVKVFERIVCDELKRYLDTIQVWNDNQHGFRRGRSCLSQLIEHHQKILDGLEEECSLDIVYLDFSKAFDKVDHKILLKKLLNIGVSGKLLRWLSNFLVGRKQAVRVEGCISGYAYVGSGVPQGSVLGPLLFLIHVSDMDSHLKVSTASSFADDTRVMMRVRSSEDHDNFQRDLGEIYAWANENKMIFNDSKFIHLHYHHPKIQIDHENYLSADRRSIYTEHDTRDLGVVMSDDANYKNHIDSIVVKGNRQASWILRTFRSRNSLSMITLFKSLVLPLLECCCQLWNLPLSRDIRKVEAVQRSYTSKIDGTCGMNYWDRLFHFSLYSLERRRQRYIIIYVFKILKGSVPNLSGSNEVTAFVSERRGLLCRIPPLRQAAMAKFRSLKESSFSVKRPRLFNCIPSNIRNLDLSEDCFKRKLDKFLRVIPDQPSLPGYAQQARNNCILEQLAVQRVDGVFL